MNKEQTLNNLYALRAGLSAISQQYDKAQEIEDECDEHLEQNAELLSNAPVCHEDYPELVKLREKYGHKNDLTEEYNEIINTAKDNLKVRLTMRKELKK